MRNRYERIRASGMAVASVLTAAAAVAAPVNVRHVAADAPPGGDGLTWATAYNDLRAALSAASGSGGAVNELWVKAGTYTPGPLGSTDLTTTFSIGDGVGVYGGFAGTETARDQADPAVRLTTLNGDLSGGKRVYHVVTMIGEDSVLDGVTVRNGYANGQTGGAGVFIIAGSSELRRCIITDNKGSENPARGGGVYCGAGTTVRLVECTLSNNSASTPEHWGYGFGGGLAALSSAVTLERCTITGNLASQGGYIGCMGGQPGGGVAGGNGGGLYFEDSAAVLNRCRITDNSSGSGAGAPVCGTGPIPTSAGGTNGGSGGGVYVDDSSVLIVECLLTGNVAGSGGWGTSVAGRTYPGGSGGHGGGVRVAGTTSTVAIINSTLAGNLHGYAGVGSPSGAIGAGAGVSSAGSLHASNSVLWNSDTSELAGSGPRVITYSDARGGAPGLGNINADPRFVSAITGDYRLSDISPCIDAGNNNADANPFTGLIDPLPVADLTGLRRFVDIAAVPDTGAGTAPIVDMGAYEVQNPCAVDLNGDGVVDFGDYLEFLNLFDAGDMRVDFTGDGIVDFADYLEFLNLFDEGC